MRSGTALVEQALSRQGRYQSVRDDLRVKEVRLDGSPGRQWVICHNPDEAEREKATRDAALERIDVELERIKTIRDRATNTSKTSKHEADLPPQEEPDEAAHAKAECALRDHPALGRWLRQLPSGRLVIDRSKVATEERLDGKYLLSTSTARRVRLTSRDPLAPPRTGEPPTGSASRRPVEPSHARPAPTTVKAPADPLSGQAAA